MQRFYETAIDTLTGAAVANVDVWVFNSADNTVAALWQDSAGTNPAQNPLTTDSNGYYEFFAADGIYSFEYRVADVSLRTIAELSIFDLADMRADIDGALTSIMSLLANTYSKTEVDALLAGVGGGTDLSDYYTKEQVDALIPGAPDLSNYYTKAEVNALIPTRYYSFGSFAASNILANEILMDHDVAVPCTLAANLAAAQVSVGTPPAATFALDVQKNGASVGTISIDNAGVVTKTTTGGAAVGLVAGDIVTVVAPGAADATIARLRFTFRGTI